MLVQLEHAIIPIELFMRLRSCVKSIIPEVEPRELIDDPVDLVVAVEVLLVALESIFDNSGTAVYFGVHEEVEKVVAEKNVRCSLSVERSLGNPTLHGFRLAAYVRVISKHRFEGSPRVVIDAGEAGAGRF